MDSGFESVFWQNLTEFLFVVYLLFFFKRLKIENRQFLIAIFGKSGNRKPIG